MVDYYYELKQNNVELLAQKEKIEKQNLNINKEKNELKKEIDDLLSSRSWRITSPLRRLSFINQNKRKN